MPDSLAPTGSTVQRRARRPICPESGFRPPRGLRHRHLQSMLSSWPLRRRLVASRAAAVLAASRPRMLQTSSGVRLLGQHAAREANAKGLAILLHGWEGCAESVYMLSGAAALYEAGYDVFRLNFRDHGGTQALNRELFHSCRIEEIVDAVRLIQRDDGAPPATFLVGYSLGGNFAIRVGARALAAGLDLRKIVAICPVLCPHSTMRALEEGLWVYRYYFLRRWRRSLLAKAAAFPDLYDFGDLRRLPTLTATTDFFVGRYTDFPDLDSYLNGYAITGSSLDGLSVPTRVIATADDPVIPSADLGELSANEALAVTLVPRGGHCGFLSDYRLNSWVDRRILAELES